MASDRNRDLYLVAYDIRDPKRLIRVHKTVMAYASGGQKSAYECFLTPSELAQLEDELAVEIDPARDRVHFFRLRRGCKVWTLGVAVAPEDPVFFFIGG